MKNLINPTKIFAALIAFALLAPVLSIAQSTPALSNPKIIESDKVGTNGSDKIDTPPPPALSTTEKVISKISFYPNPCKDQLNLEFGDDARFQKVYIYNLVGNLLYEATVPGTNAVINTSNLKTGIYLLRTKTASYRFTKI